MKKVLVFASMIALVCGLTLNAQTPQAPKKEVKKEAKEVKKEVKAEAKEVKKAEKGDAKKAEKKAEAKPEVKK